VGKLPKFTSFAPQTLTQDFI